MADKHTPEPWEIGTQTRGSEICTIHGVTRRPSDDGCGQGWVYIHYPRVIDGKYHYPDEAENDANARRIVACVNALKGFSTEAIEAGGVQELAEALREIRDMKPREYTGPEFDREASDACPDCIKYQGHPIQQGICDEHRRPFYAREDHDKFEERAKGSRCYLIARAALSKWEASK